MLVNYQLYYPLINNNSFKNKINQNKSNQKFNYQSNINKKHIPNKFGQKNNLINYQFNKLNQQYSKSNKFDMIFLNYQNCITQNHKNSSLKMIQNSYEKVSTTKLNKNRKIKMDTCENNFKAATTNEEEKKQNVEIEELTSKMKKQSNIFSFSNKKQFHSEKEKKKNKEAKKRENKFDDISLKTNENYELNPFIENTEILRINVKISKDKIKVFTLKRYDDIFKTINLFCKINFIDEKLIKPITIRLLSTLNTIYQIMNSELNTQQIKILQKIKNI